MVCMLKNVRVRVCLSVCLSVSSNDPFQSVWLRVCAKEVTKVEYYAQLDFLNCSALLSLQLQKKRLNIVFKITRQGEQLSTVPHTLVNKSTQGTPCIFSTIKQLTVRCQLPHLRFNSSH